MCGTCARRRRTGRVERGPSPRQGEREEKSAGEGIRLARERKRDLVGGTATAISSKPTYTYTHPTHANGCTLGRQARALQTARLPPRTFGKINRIQEKPMVRQASGALSSSTLIFSVFLSLSSSYSLFLSFSLPLAPASLSPTTLPASRRISCAHTRYPCSPLLATKRGRTRVYTLAIDGDRRHACTHDGQGRR